jgi:hypothetical protein
MEDCEEVAALLLTVEYSSGVQIQQVSESMRG